jgi:hypothetical protein
LRICATTQELGCTLACSRRLQRHPSALATAREDMAQSDANSFKIR